MPTSTGASDLSQSSGAASTDTGDDLCSSGMIYRPATGELAAYCIDSTEVTVAAYGEIMNSGHVPEPIEGCGSVDGPAWYMRGEVPVSRAHSTPRGASTGVRPTSTARGEASVCAATATGRRST